MWAAIALIMATTTVVTGCSSDSDNDNNVYLLDTVELPTLELTSEEQKLVDDNNEFAFSLFRTAQDGKKSQILSPISITYALGMLNNGAAGETQAQINNVLGFGNTGAQDINAFCNKMLYFGPNLDSLTKVMIANNIYLNKGYELKPEFVRTANSYYGADVETRDFHDGKTMDVINQWASDHTEQMIRKVLNEDSFNPDAVSYLLNAIYFKGSWTSKFNKAETVKEVFTHAGDTEELTHADMMHQMASFDYAEDEDYQALRLPYGNGSFRMTVLLPKKNTHSVPAVPTAEAWQNLNLRMMGTQVDVKLPCFETDTDIDLKKIMIKLGMPDAFDGGKADFSNFCNVPVYIDLMKQVAKIKLDEEGTEAAAVTVVGVLDSVATQPSIVSFHANHPFLYIISEQNTGAIFFIGQYTGY